MPDADGPYVGTEHRPGSAPGACSATNLTRHPVAQIVRVGSCCTVSATGESPVEGRVVIQNMNVSEFGEKVQGIVASVEA